MVLRASLLEIIRLEQVISILGGAKNEGKYGDVAFWIGMTEEHDRERKDYNVRLNTGRNRYRPRVWSVLTRRDI